MNRNTFAVAALALMAATSPLAAQKPTSKAHELVVVASNVTARAEAAAGKARRDSIAVPGDVVEYQLVFTNTRDFPLKNVVFQDPVPGGLFYVPATAKSTRTDVVVEYSIDKGASWSAQPTIEVIEDGKKVTRPAQPEQYTNVRWRVTGMVAPGATVEARFRTRVGNVPPKKAETNKPAVKAAAGKK